MADSVNKDLKTEFMKGEDLEPLLRPGDRIEIQRGPYQVKKMCISNARLFCYLIGNCIICSSRFE